MRIIAGKYKGRKLAEFEHKKLRPTSDKNRESLFNILINSSILKEYGFELKGSTVLDGFCGTGSVGFETLSRGAKFVTFIDNNKVSLSIAKKNDLLLDTSDQTEFLCADLRQLSRTGVKTYDLIFLDPPYAYEDTQKAVKSLIKNGYVTQKTILIIEYESRRNLELGNALKSLFKKRYGNTTFEFLVLQEK